MNMWIFAMACALSVGAGPRHSIEQAYQKSSEAMELKFFEGVRSIRSPDYELYDVDGHKTVPAVEQARLERAFGQSLSVREAFQILDFRPQGKAMVCTVRYQTDFRVLDPVDERPVNLQMVTTCQDRWMLFHQDWRLKRSRITHQVLSRKKES